MADGSYATAELMAAVLAHELRDDDFAAVGAAAQIPMCALRLAQRTHAPNLWSLYGGSGAVNSKLPALLESAADFRNLMGAEYRAPLQDIIDYEFTGRFTVACLGGMQVDQYGAMNMVAIGDYAHPRVRGPGTVGLAFMAAFQRVLIYVQHHDAGALAHYRPTCAQGPVLVVTPRAVMNFASPDRRMRLRSIHPGQTADDVMARTGFALAMTEPVPETEPPTTEELRIIREELDPQGVLRRLIR